MSRRTHLLVLGCACALAACGDDGDRVAGTTPAATEPPATATASPVPTATATATAAPTATATTEPDAGDESGNRVDVRFELGAGAVEPERVEVPAFLGLRLRVRNESGGERLVRLAGEPVLELLPGGDERVELEGLRPGEHLLEAGASGRAVIVAVRAGG